MSIKLMTMVWDSDLPKDQKMVALAYADHADDFGRQIYPSVGYVAWKTGYSERSVQNITRALQETGVLSLAGKSHLKTNLFIMDAAKLPQREEYKGKPDGRPPKEGAESAPTSEDEPEKWVQNKEKSVSPAAPKPSVLDPSDTSPSPKEKKEPARKKTERQLILAELEKFFSAQTRLPLPHRKTEKQKRAGATRWWNPLWEMYELTSDLDRTKGYISLAVSHMREEGLTISAPQSIQSNVLDLFAKGTDVDPDTPRAVVPEGW